MIFFSFKRLVVLGVAGVVVLAVIVASFPLFIVPDTNQPRKVDAIVVLGGAGPRISKGIQLAREGYAPLLVVSIGVQMSPANCQRIFYASPSVQVICFKPSPLTTQGEARFVGQLAKQRDLHSILVVSGTAQTTRARLRLSRCYSGTVLVDPVWPSGFISKLHSVVYEWGALIKALTVQRSC